MDDSIHLYLFRHGHSKWQAGLTTDRDSELTTLGISQSHYLIERLEQLLNTKKSPPRIISSPMKRALQTAASLGASIPTDNRLCEAEFHVSSQLCFPRSALNSEPTSNLSPNYAHFRSGIKSFLNEQLAQKSTEPLVVFSHGGVIKTMLRIFSGSDVVDFKIANCSLSEACWDGARWRIIRINETSYLPPQLLT